MQKAIQVKHIYAAKKFLNRNITIREIIFFTALAVCLVPAMPAPAALLLGIFVAQFIGNPYLHINHKATRLLLQVSVVGLGFGMNVTRAVQAGKQGLLLAIISIATTLLLGYIAGRLLKIDKKASYLISAGTAICGGSAIAAIAPVINAQEKQISVALGTIFILNSVALFSFPAIGAWLHLTQTQFGLWSAVAIHDTSSVVGAAGKYGSQALEIATTVKLARALWIIPVAFLSALLFGNKNSKLKLPWFILLFIVAMAINTYLPVVQAYSHYVTTAAKACLTLTLFLIGSGLSKKVLLSVGYKPLLQGVVLWIVISAGTLWAVLSFMR